MDRATATGAPGAATGSAETQLHRSPRRAAAAAAAKGLAVPARQQRVVPESILARSVDEENDGDDETETEDRFVRLVCYRRPAAAEVAVMLSEKISSCARSLLFAARRVRDGVLLAATWTTTFLSVLAHYTIRAAILFVTGYFISVLIIRQLVQLQQILLLSADSSASSASDRREAPQPGMGSISENERLAVAGWNSLGAGGAEAIDSHPVSLAITLLAHLIHRRFSWDSIPHWCGLGAAVVGTAYTLADLIILGRLHRMQRNWSNVLRCVGGFVGICYAATKLPWSSSNLQASCSLALISACMWFSFDCTTHGLAISLLTTCIGTGFVFYFVTTGMYSFVKADVFGVPSWIPCILFSSCICLGLIGRQLQVVPRRWYRHHQHPQRGAAQFSPQKKRGRKTRYEHRLDYGHHREATFRTTTKDSDWDRTSILATPED